MEPKEALKIIGQQYTDSTTSIVMENRDGGDSLHKFAIVTALCKLQDIETDYLDRPLQVGYEETMAKYEVTPGQLVRHPNPPWNNPIDEVFPSTRDQVDMGFVVMDIIGDKERAIRTAQAIVDNRFRYASGDIMSPEHFSHMLRAISLNTMGAELMHIAGDGFLLLHSVIRVVAAAYDPDDTSNDVHHILNLIHGRKNHPSILNFLAKFIYSFRPRSGPKTGPRLEGFGPSTAVEWYFRPETGSPPIAPLFIPLIERYLR